MAQPLLIRTPRAVLRRKIVAFLILYLLCSLLIVFGTRAGILERYELQVKSQTIKWASQFELPDPRIKVIVVDQQSLNSRAQDGQVWPWPRQMYVPVLRFLSQAHARGLAFDMLFTEHSARDVEDDSDFATATAQSGVPVIFAVNPLASQTSGASIEEWQLLLHQRQSKFEEQRQGALKYLNHSKVRRRNFVQTPIPELMAAASGFGSVSGVPDLDGVFRRVEPGVIVKQTPLLSLPFALYEATTPRNGRASIDDMQDEKGLLTIRFSGPRGTYKTYSYDAITESYLRLRDGKEPLVPLSEFKDSWVFFGVDAMGLLDLRPTPLGEVYPGVELNATTLDNLVNSKFAKPFSTKSCIAIGLLVLLICVGSIIFVLDTWIGTTLMLLSCGGILVGLTVACAAYGFVLPLLHNLCAVLTGGVGAIAVQYGLEGRQYKFIRDAFRHYVSPEVIEKIRQDPTALSLGGEKRELTIFFSDIAGFTSISEQLEPSALVALMNEFLGEMTDIILRSGGTLDKYVGDAIIAFWNAPIAVSDHALKATFAALECQARSAQLHYDLKNKYGVDVRMRIGIHTGFVSVGNFGSRERFNYTVLGDTANLASRLEGANKRFGTSILISDKTFEQADSQINARLLGHVRVIGRSEPVAVYEPIQDEEKAGIAKFDRARSFFENKNFDSAVKEFSELEQDSVVAAFLDRIAREREIPLDKWSSVWNLEEK